MNENGWRYKIRKNRILKAVRQNRRQPVFPKFSSIQRIGCIGSNPVNSAIIFSKFNAGVLTNYLQFSAGKRPKGDESEVIFLSDLNFLGIPPRKLIKDFVDIPFDILINFSKGQQEAIDYICASSVAKFKVGKLAYPAIYDLVINGEAMDDTEYLNEIIRTLNNFNN